MSRRCRKSLHVHPCIYPTCGKLPVPRTVRCRKFRMKEPSIIWRMDTNISQCQYDGVVIFKHKIRTPTNQCNLGDLCSFCVIKMIFQFIEVYKSTTQYSTKFCFCDSSNYTWVYLEYQIYLNHFLLAKKVAGVLSWKVQGGVQLLQDQGNWDLY